MTVSAEQFREGMRRLAASVTILATRDAAGGRFGMTATAVCSVSNAPPTLLCCINRDNQTHAAIARSGRFSVNALAAGDEELASTFARRLAPEDRFMVGCWSLHESGVPVLDNAVAWFACQTVQAVEVGSHAVFFGEIAGIRTRGAQVMPLLYAHGGYGKFAGPSPSLLDLMWTPDWQVYD